VYLIAAGSAVCQRSNDFSQLFRARDESRLEFRWRSLSKENRHKLHEHLRTQPSLVMFDGLDEIFDPHDYESVVDEIANFATQQWRC
jgi:predicted NACHT family NTPase